MFNELLGLIIFPSNRQDVHNTQNSSTAVS